MRTEYTCSADSGKSNDMEIIGDERKSSFYYILLLKRSFSYELQRMMTKGAIRGPFDEAIDSVLESTGVSICKRSAEEIVKDAAQDFDVPSAA